MHHEAVIRLEIEEHEGGSLYVSSPDVPFLQIVVRDRDELQKVVPPLVKELLERNRNIRANVRMINVLEAECPLPGRVPAPHIIAQMSA